MQWVGRVLACASWLSGACAGFGDVTGVPDRLDPRSVALVLPSVVDARTRLAPAIDDSQTRDRTVAQITLLEMALERGDRDGARQAVLGTRSLLFPYSLDFAGSEADADVVAIELMLHLVLELVDPSFDTEDWP